MADNRGLRAGSSGPAQSPRQVFHETLGLALSSTLFGIIGIDSESLLIVFEGLIQLTLSAAYTPH